MYLFVCFFFLLCSSFKCFLPNFLHIMPCNDWLIGPFHMCNNSRKITDVEDMTILIYLYFCHILILFSCVACPLPGHHSGGEPGGTPLDGLTSTVVWNPHLSHIVHIDDLFQIIQSEICKPWLYLLFSILWFLPSLNALLKVVFFLNVVSLTPLE